MELGPIVKSKKTSPSLFIRLLALSWPSCSCDCLVCAALIIHKRKGEREREGGGREALAFLNSCHVNMTLSFLPSHLRHYSRSFVHPPLLRLVVCGTGRALTSVAPVAHRTQSAPPPSRWHVSFDLPPLFTPSIFCPRQIIVWLGSLDHLGLEVQRRNIHVLALVALLVPLFS